MDLQFRRVTPKDRDFLQELFASALDQDVAVMNWSAEQRDTYMNHQFKAQLDGYRKKFPGSSFQIILVDGEQAGRIFIDRRSDEIRIVDLVLLQRFRGQGIGSQLVGDLCKEATEKNVDVGVHIPKGWCAMRLAQRLGFQRKLEAEFTDYMVWTPGTLLA